MSASAERDPEWRDWFQVINLAFVGRDDVDWNKYYDWNEYSLDFKMPELHQAFIRRLREEIPTWRSLGLSAGYTSATYADGRVWILASAPIDGTAYTLRVDVAEHEWAAAWVTSGNSSDVLNVAEALPLDLVSGSMTDPQQGIHDAVEWFERQLRTRRGHGTGRGKRKHRR